MACLAACRPSMKQPLNSRLNGHVDSHRLVAVFFSPNVVQMFVGFPYLICQIYEVFS
jgi:hypothetical protein